MGKYAKKTLLPKTKSTNSVDKKALKKQRQKESARARAKNRAEKMGRQGVKNPKFLQIQTPTEQKFD